MRTRTSVVLLAVLTATIGLACSGRYPRKPIHIPESANGAVPHYQYFGTKRLRRLSPQTAPQHPYMAPNGRSSMHADAYSTNVYNTPGPTGRNTKAQSDKMGSIGGECPHVVFDRTGRAITVCMHARKPVLRLMEMPTLNTLDKLALPARKTPLFNLRKMAADTSGGAYFYLDNDDRIVVGTSAGDILTIDVEEEPAPHFEVVRSIDVRHALRLPTRPDKQEIDRISSVMPDWNGRLWFVGRYGTVGSITQDGRDLRFVHLENEEIENSFSVGKDGVYILSDHALYRFEAAPDGSPRVVWRETYDRGSRRKVGQINQGSGTTPTLIGEDYITIADNAEPQLQVVVYKRARKVAGSRVFCKAALFEPGHSAAENNFIAYRNSIIVENNADYDLFRTMRHGRVSAPGVARVDLRRGKCKVVWVSQERSQTTLPKLSTQTGLVYLYTKLPAAPDHVDAYYFTGLDFRSGKTVFRVLAGTGSGYDNNWAAISLAPDGSAFVGVLNGLVRLSEPTE